MSDSLYSTALIIPLLLVAAAMLIVTWRMLVGPNSMDRIIGMEGLIAIIQCAGALFICVTLNTTVVNAMLVVALLGFISSIAVARFRKRDGAK